MIWHVYQLCLIVSGVTDVFIPDVLPGETTDTIWHVYQLCLTGSGVTDMCISDLLPGGTSDTICLPLAISFVCQPMSWCFFWIVLWHARRFS